MNLNKYWDEFPSAVTICDNNAIIIYMNNRAAITFSKWGGKKLIGQSLYDCHNEKSCSIIKQILKTGVGNTYTIEKQSKKKLIHQTPWFNQNIIAGITEISIELPENMKHFIR